MSILHKIIVAAADCLAQGGGGSTEFYKRQIEIMPDYDRAVFANLLKTEMPTLTAKFQKIGKYEAWWLTRLVEHLWHSKIRTSELLTLCRRGVNDSNVTLDRVKRNLHNVLDRCVPDYKIVSGYEGEEKVQYYTLGELGAASDRFLSLYPNATFPEVDEDALAKRREAEAAEHEVELEERAEYKRWEAAFNETRYWAERPKHRLADAKRALESAQVAERAKAPEGNQGNQGAPAIVEAQEEVKLAEHALGAAEAAKRPRQLAQIKRQEDGLPMYGPDEGPAQREDVPG